MSLIIQIVINTQNKQIKGNFLLNNAPGKCSKTNFGDKLIGSKFSSITTTKDSYIKK